MKNKLLITFTALIFNLVCSQSVDPLLSKLLDKQFPVEHLKDENNLDFKIESLHEKPTLINIWFTSCRPCVEELPYLNELQNKLSPQVNFVAITFDSKEKVDQFLSKHEFNFKHLKVSYQDLERTGIYKYPLNFILDSQGTIRRILGGIDGTEIGEVIKIFETLE